MLSDIKLNIKTRNQKIKDLQSAGTLKDNHFMTPKKSAAAIEE